MTTKGFQHIITIDQKAVIECGLNVDIIDMAIFDFMKSYSASPKCTKVFFENKFYFYLSSSVILERMPMLGISTKRGICKRIDNLINAGLLERHPNNQEIGKAMYTFGSMYDQYIFCATQEQKFQGGMNKSSEGVRTEVPTPMNESSDNNSTTYNNTTYNNTIDNISPQSPQGDVLEFSLEEELFERFRKAYKGTKRGHDIEFCDFKKKHKDWREVVKFLLPAYERQEAIRKKQEQDTKWRPQQKNLKTYLSQRCWEEEITYEQCDEKSRQHDEIERARQDALKRLRSRGFDFF